MAACTQSIKQLMIGLFTFTLSLTGAIAHHEAYFSSGEGPIILDNVHCSGSEEFLLSCASLPVYSHNCHHSEDAGVSCQS